MAAAGDSIRSPRLACALLRSRAIFPPRSLIRTLPSSILSVMSLDIHAVARLARLELSAEEEQQYGRELGSVLDFVEALKRVDVEGVEPTAHTADLTNVFRADEPRPGLETADALANAPRAANGLFLVPKVIEN